MEKTISANVGVGFVGTLDATEALKASLEMIYVTVVPGLNKIELPAQQRARQEVELIHSPSDKLTTRVKMTFRAMPGVENLVGYQQ